MQPRPDLLIAILAAGAGSRFNGEKLAAPLCGKPLGHWALDAALEVHCPVIWIGSSSSLDLASGRCDAVLNKSPDLGISHTIALAINAAVARDAQHLLVMLADMPLVTSDLLREMVDLGGPCACDYGNGRVGVPAIIPRAMFPAVLRLTGDVGAASVLSKSEELKLVSAVGDILFDVDQNDDLQRAAHLLQKRGTPSGGSHI